MIKEMNFLHVAGLSFDAKFTNVFNLVFNIFNPINNIKVKLVNFQISPNVPDIF